MKLPIKKEYYDLIQMGEKRSEFRDAHITFVCESTGRMMTFDLTGVALLPRNDMEAIGELPLGVCSDDKVIVFGLNRRIDHEEGR